MPAAGFRLKRCSLAMLRCSSTDRRPRSMANSGPGTNGSQFFLNMKDNTYLNGKHTVFGKVLTGMDIIDKMQKVKMKAPSKPEKDIKIISIRKIAKPAKDK